MDEVIGLLRGRVVLCGQLLKLFTELIDVLKSNSTNTAELTGKIETIIKSLSDNASKSQIFLDKVKVNSLAEFIFAQEKDIKRDVAEKLLTQADNFQQQLKIKMDTAAQLITMGKKFVDLTLNVMTQTRSGNTYGASAETPGQSKRHIFDASC